MVGEYASLRMRPLSSSVFTQVKTDYSKLAGLNDVGYDRVTDQIYYATSKYLGHIDRNIAGATPQTLITNGECPGEWIVLLGQIV